MSVVTGTEDPDLLRTGALGGSGSGLPDLGDDGDTVDGLAGGDTILAGAGADLLDGGADDDSIEGGEGGDTLIGLAGADVLIGGAAGDLIIDGEGDDTVDAGDGDDTVMAGDGADSLIGGDGVDLLDFADAPSGVAIVLGQGDIFGDGFGYSEIGAFGFENANGSYLADPFFAGGGAGNVLRGRTGNDLVLGGGGDDTLYGEEDNDTVIGEEEADLVFGGDGDDRLVGGRWRDFDGTPRDRDDFAADTLRGEAGNDTLVLGEGDEAEGGEGDDIFEFAVDLDQPLAGQPITVGTAVFAGNRGDYEIYDNGFELYVIDQTGTGGWDMVGRSLLSSTGGPQAARFLRFADQTVDVEAEGLLRINYAPVINDAVFEIDANSGGIGTSLSFYDPEGDFVDFAGVAQLPQNGELTVHGIDGESGTLGFTYVPNAGFIGTDSFQVTVNDAYGSTTATVTLNVVFDSSVVDFYDLGVGRSVVIDAPGVGGNDADINGEPPIFYEVIQDADGVAVELDPYTGAVTLTQESLQNGLTYFVYRAHFNDGTSNTAPVFISVQDFEETIEGTELDDAIFGYGQNDELSGLAGADTLDGGDGHDRLIGGAGDDLLRGGLNTEISAARAAFAVALSGDVAVYSGLREGYLLEQTGIQVVVTDIDLSDGDDGADTVTGVERLAFADQEIEIVNNYDPLAGFTDGRLVNGLGGAAGFGEFFLGRNDDGSSDAIGFGDLFGGPLDFYGQVLDQVFVNNNGNITFTEANGGFSPNPLGGSTPFAIIAGYWTDLDTRFGPVAASPGGNSTGSNLVHWDMDELRQTLTVTWDDVAIYNTGNTSAVAMQLQLIGRGSGDFDIVFRYEHADSPRTGRAGFANQDDTAIYELPGSGSSALNSIDSVLGNTGLPGVWLFRVRDGSVAPSAVPESYATNEDTALVVAAPGVLDNDIDPIGRPLYAILDSLPRHGSVLLNQDGSFSYTPFSNYSGGDSFTYRAFTDGPSSDAVTVTLTVNAVNDRPSDIVISNVLTPENLVSGVNTGIGVTVGTLSGLDVETPTPDLVYALVDDAGGRFVLEGRVLKTAGVLDYEEAPFRDIRVRVSDAEGESYEETLRIFLQNINEGPSEIYLSGPGAIYENLPPGILLGTLTTNEGEGDPITYSRLSGPVTVVGDKVYANVSFDYEFQTQFTFVIRAAQPGGDGVDRQFTIFVDNLNEAPTANPDFETTLAGESVTIPVLDNDTDPDGDETTFLASFTQPANGAVSVSAAGLVYTPNDGFTGTDVFEYTITDGDFESSALVEVLVRPGEVVAVADVYSTIEEQPIFFNVLLNDYLALPGGGRIDYPAPGADFFVLSFTQAQHGTVEAFGPGGQFLRYTPFKDFYGEDRFDYIASDPYGESFFPATVTITVTNVNDQPYQVYVPQFETVENRELLGVLDIDVGSCAHSFIFEPDNLDPPDELRVYPGMFSTANGGTVTIHENLNFEYMPADGFTGTDTFEVSYNDFAPPTPGCGDAYVEQGPIQYATVAVRVVPDEPDGRDDVRTIGIGETITFNVLSNDFSPLHLPLEAQPLGGDFAIGADGTVTFTGSASGTFYAYYRPEDSEGRSDLDITPVVISVLPEPPPPTSALVYGTSWGDPHFVSMDGLYYDMQGQGEFVLLRATAGETFEVQIRTRPWYEGAQVTIVEAVAAAIGGHRIMLHEDGTLQVDGVVTSLAAGGDPLVLTGGVMLWHTDADSYVFADRDTGEQVRVDGVGIGYLNVTPYIATGRANAVEGLLGDFDGDRANDLQLADGTVLAQPVDILDLYGLFANAWRVTDADSLFVYADGESTDDFQRLDFPPSPLSLDGFPADRVAAARAVVEAAGITDPFLQQAAILDLLLTGEDGFIQGAQGAPTPTGALEVIVPPTPDLVGLAGPLAAVAEGDSGLTAVTFTIYRTGDADTAATFGWSVQAGGLGFTDAADHGGALPSGTVTLDIGETSKDFTINVSGDTAGELDERIRVVLGAPPEGYVVGAASAQATVTNDDGPVLPDAVDDEAETTFGLPVVISPLGNDIDPISAGISIIAVGAAGHGTVQRVGSLVTYRPDAGFAGEDSFTYTIRLAGGGTDTATVAVTVAPPPPPPNTAPVANPDALDAVAGVTLQIEPSAILGNDTDADSDTLSVTGIHAMPQHGTAVFEAGTGRILYTATSGYSGTDTIIYAVSDGEATVFGSIILTVVDLNEPPVLAVPPADQAAEANTAFAFLLPAGTFTDPDAGDVLTLSATLESGAPLPAWLSFDPATGGFSGTPGAGDVATLQVRVTATDDEGESASDIFALVVGPDATPPAAPDAPALDAASDTGLAGDNITRDATPTVTGIAEAGSTVRLYAGVALLGEAVADASTGAYAITSTALSDGTHALVVTATDAAGNASVASGALSVTVDTAPPAAPSFNSIATDTGAPNDLVTSDATLQFIGRAAAGSLVEVTLDGGSIGTAVADSRGVWTLDHGGTVLADGSHVVRAHVSDIAGNTASSTARTVVVDTAAATPSVLSIVADTGRITTDGITSDTGLVIRGRGEANNTVEVFLDGALLGTSRVGGNGIWTYDHSAASLADGDYAITARATDRAGNVSAESAAFTAVVDTAAPDAPGIAGSLVGTVLTLTGMAEAFAQLTITRGGASFGTAVADATGAFSLSRGGIRLTDAAGFEFEARAADLAGNVSAIGQLTTLEVSAAAGANLRADGSALPADIALTLLGTAANDLAFGGAGADLIVAGAGVDRLRGGAGPDVFVFQPATGNDRVEDFLPGTDRLDLQGFAGASAAALLAAAVAAGADTRIVLGGGDSVLLVGVAKASLSAADFILA
jgi:Ca2+-binding RTX toxin-like protein